MGEIMASLYAIWGVLYDTDGTTAIANATVKIRNESTNNTLTETTDANGGYVFNCGNFADGWTNGDLITIYAIYTNYSASHTVTIDTTTYPGEIEQNLTLTAITEAALRYFTPQEFLDTFDLNSYDNDTEHGIKLNTIIKVGQAIESEIDRLTNRTWDSNSGNYYTSTQEYHDAEGSPSIWPDSIGAANITSQSTYFTNNTPIYSLTTFQVNLNAPSTTPNWTTLTEAAYQIKVKKNIGRIEITDTQNYPAAGKDQVRITYNYGETSVPYDIKRLAILMTAKAFAGQSLQRLNINATEASGLGSAIQNLGNVSEEIKNIIASRKFSDVRVV